MFVHLKISVYVWIFFEVNTKKKFIVAVFFYILNTLRWKNNVNRKKSRSFESLQLKNRIEVDRKEYVYCSVSVFVYAELLCSHYVFFLIHKP